MFIRGRLIVLTCAAFSLLGRVQSAHAQMPPEQELKTLRAADEFNVSLFASEPMITNPSAIDVDTHGRVWVAEIQWYRGKAKNPPADAIKVLEDTDGDGRADKVTTFVEGLFAPMSVCVAGDKVYVATSPDLWVYEDKDGDLKADGPPKKLLTGFGGHNHDHGAHSLVLGPDHKWWMSHGDTGFDVTGTDGSHIKFQWGAMLRGELDGSKLETIAVNFRNPYEICMNSFGESFVSDNDNDGNESVRICWIMEGGNYGWFGSPPFGKNELDAKAPPGTPFREAWHFRGFMPGFVPGTLVTGFGSPTGICFYEGDAFGPKYKNAPLHTDCGPREVRVYRHTKHGAGMKATSEVFLTTQGDGYFRPDDICTAPDGSLYVADWYDGGVGGHGYNDRDRGRIFVLTPKSGKPQRRDKPGPYANIEDAIAGLKSPNLATQYLARERLLAEGDRSAAALKNLLSDPEPNFRARALWVLDRIGGEQCAVVVDHLKNQDPAMRALAVRILGRHGEEFAAPILALAKDSSPEVRREVLLTMRNLSGPAALDALVDIIALDDGGDRYMLEAINIAAGQDKERRQQLYAKLEKDGKLAFNQFALLQLLNPQAASSTLMAKLTQSGVNPDLVKSLLETAGNIQSLDAGRSVLELVANEAAPADVRRLALNKLLANLSGNWSQLAGDEKLLSTFAKLLGDKQLAPPILDAVGNLNLQPLAGRVLAIATEPAAEPGLRQQAIAVAAQLRAENTTKVLRGLLEDREPKVRGAALDALVDLQDVKTLREVLSGDKFSADVRSSVADRLMETTAGALVLLRLIDARQLPEQLAHSLIAKAASHPDSNIRVLYEKFIPESERPKKLGESIKAEDLLKLSGDAKRGENIFFQSSAAQCKSCHAVQGVGGHIGPELTRIGKKYERASLLETILDPSKAISHEYVPYLLENSSGQVYAGFLVSKNDQQVVLKDIKGQLIRTPAAEIEALVEQKKSLMPELVLRDVTAQDAADLLAYLTTLKEGNQDVAQFRVLGPFDTNRRNLDAKFPPEDNIASPDLEAEYPSGFDGKTNRWEVVTSDGALGFTGIDSVKYDRSRKMRDHAVTHYFLAYADSPIDQPVKLLIGSDDGCKVWLNGQSIHKNNTTRALGYAQDQVDAKLNKGRNVIVIKVVNGNPPGGVSLALRSQDDVQLKTE